MQKSNKHFLAQLILGLVLVMILAGISLFFPIQEPAQTPKNSQLTPEVIQKYFTAPQKINSETPDSKILKNFYAASKQGIILDPSVILKYYTITNN